MEKRECVCVFPVGSQTDLLQRSLDIYGNSPNFSLATLNANSESAGLGQGSGNGEGEQAEGSQQAWSSRRMGKQGWCSRALTWIQGVAPEGDPSGAEPRPGLF